MTTEKPVEETPEVPEPPKASRGEKKFKKAMMKMGLKPMEGFTRATLKTTKSMLLYIDNPFVMTTGVNEHNYLIFGEAKIFDFKNALSKEKMQKFNKGRTAKESNVPETVVEEQEEVKEDEVKEEKEEEIDESKFNEEDIKSIMDYSKCDRQAAVKALAKANGDVIDAISYVS